MDRKGLSLVQNQNNPRKVEAYKLVELLIANGEKEFGIGKWQKTELASLQLALSITACSIAANLSYLAFR